MALSSMRTLLHLANATSRETCQLFAGKQEKHNLIKLLTQTKLGSISDAITQIIQDGTISPTEFHKILQEMQKYRKLK